MDRPTRPVDPHHYSGRPATEAQILYVKGLCRRHGLEIREVTLLSAEETSRWCDFMNAAGYR